MKNWGENIIFHKMTCINKMNANILMYKKRAKRVEEGGNVELTFHWRWKSSWTSTSGTFRNRCPTCTRSFPSFEANSVGQDRQTGKPPHPEDFSLDLLHFQHRNCKKITLSTSCTNHHWVSLTISYIRCND